MNRSFPAEKIEPCDQCGRDLTLVVTPDGWLEANDVRDYVWTETKDRRDWVILCAACRYTSGLDEE